MLDKKYRRQEISQSDLDPPTLGFVGVSFACAQFVVGYCLLGSLARHRIGAELW